MPIETIIEKTFGLRIEYQYLTNDARELGRMIYDSGVTTYYDRDRGDYALMRVEGGTMLIEASLLEDERCYGRLRFTLAHELAHYILHKRIFSGTGVAAACGFLGSGGVGETRTLAPGFSRPTPMTGA